MAQRVAAHHLEKFEGRTNGSVGGQFGDRTNAECDEQA
jgi:hypothetical protein